MKKTIHSSSFHRRSPSLWAAIVGAAFAVTGLTTAVLAENTKIVVADAKTTHHLNLYVAKELGLFGKQGLDVEIIESKDAAASRDAVVSGQADAFWSCPTAAIAAIANGAPIKIVSQVKKPCTSVLVVKPDSPIKEYKDLKDKRIGGISPTCEAVISITAQAKKNDGAFILEKLAGGPAIAALEANQIDGAILEEPHVSIAELKGYKVLFRDASENIPCRTINVRAALLKDKPEAIRNFVKAIAEANEIILKNPTSPQVVAIAEKFTGAPAAAIKHGNNRLKFTTKLDVQGLSLLADELVNQGNIKENPGNRLYAEEFKGATWN